MSEVPADSRNDGDDKLARRAAVCFLSCCGISTAALEKITALPVRDRPAALAEAARRRAS
jgi:hypothetical protein